MRHHRLRTSEAVYIFIVFCWAVWLVNASTEQHHSSSRVRTRTRSRPAPSHWREEEEYEESTNSRRRLFSKTQEQEKLHTSLGRLAKEFEPALIKRGHRRFLEIDTHHLLQACRKLEASMRNIGQSQAAKEMENNIRKVEALYKHTPHKERRTLTSFLKYEKALGIHGPNGLLKDPSAAIGLLWIRRSLSFQYKMYSVILDHPHKSPIEATMAAYHHELEPYHAWPLRRLYSIALKTGTPSQPRDMLARLGGFSSDTMSESQERATRRDMKQLLGIWRPLLARWKQIYHDLDLEDLRRV